MSPGRDERFMRRALALARRGGVRVSPNPNVGCVLARAGRIVAEGWHAAFGGPHAEAAALRRAGRKARGATAYVTLEPCRHAEKKTPPCVPALIAAGVRRVVAGMADPNPNVSGRGFKELETAGVRVTAGVLRKECEALNRRFIVRMRRRRPYVILKAAVSLDGRVAAASGRSRWITSPRARALARRMRAEADAVLVGIGTALADDPRLATGIRGRAPLKVVLDSRLRLPRTARLLEGKAPTLIATTLPRPSVRMAAEVASFPGPNGRVDLRALLSHLLRRGIGTLWVEGGSRVHTAFLEAGLADELRLFVAPKLLGGEAAPGFFEGRGAASPEKAPRVEPLEVRRVGPDLLLTGYIRHAK